MPSSLPHAPLTRPIHRLDPNPRQSGGMKPPAGPRHAYTPQGSDGREWPHAPLLGPSIARAASPFRPRGTRRDTRTIR
eukprot:scaffold9401_cov83-Isochrysis_galbana.AAC.1